MLRLIGLGTAATMGGATLAGCSKEAGSKGSATKADAIRSVLPTYKSAEVLKPDIPGEGRSPRATSRTPSSSSTRSPSSPAGAAGRSAP